jgi:hypothetical protein
MTLDPRTAEFTTLLGTSGSITAMAVIGILITIINGILHAIPSRDGPEAAKTFYLGPKNGVK